MGELKVFPVKKGLSEENKRIAESIRAELRAKKVFFINIMSSPGSGKTRTLVSTIKALREELRIGVIEADVDSDVDAQAVQAAGAKAVQMHTGGLCHLDATMVKTGLDELEPDGLDLVFLENIGNLICPVGYDTGAMRNVAILSIPEGDDKPLKYPKIFAAVDALIISKIDVAPFFDFSLLRLEQSVRKLNPAIEIFPVSAVTGQGMDAWLNWITREMKGDCNEKTW